MKKSILLLASMFALVAKGQTIDTSVCSPYPVAILTKPFQPNWQDTTKARYLNVSITSDNLKDNAIFHWVLFGVNNKPLQMGDVTCKDEDYFAWNGDNSYPFAFVASQLGLAIK